jgi:hypothetical protein
MEQRQLDAERIDPGLPEARTLLAAVALERLLGIGRHLALQEILCIEGREELHELVLRDRAAVTIDLLARGRPGLVEGAASVEQLDDAMHPRRQPMEALRDRIDEQDPRLAAQAAVQRQHAFAQARAQEAHGVPVLGEKRLHLGPVNAMRGRAQGRRRRHHHQPTP